MAVMIGVDPHKGSHTAVAVDETEQSLGELRVRSGPSQLDRLLGRAGRFPERTWAVENASGLGYLVAQQLVAAGERVVDVQPKLAARVRLLATQATNKNDSHDARSVAIAALRSPAPTEVRAEDHAAVARLWSKRQRDLARARNKVAAGCTRCSASWSPEASRTRSRPPRRPHCWLAWSPTGPWWQPGSSSATISSRTSAASTPR